MLNQSPVESPLPALGERDVHVWRIALDVGTARLEELRQLLAPEENQRAEAFYLPKLGHRFCVAHGVLRTLLGRYLGKSPKTLHFVFNPYGKPRLAEVPDAHLEFNLTHSHDMALVALCRKSPIGIDLELMDQTVDIEAISSLYFAAEEHAELQTLPREIQREGFFNCWTRKEAYLKARGQGFSRALSEFVVSLTPGVDAGLLMDRLDATAASRWSLHALDVPANYAASLAVEHRDRVIAQFDWSE